MASSSSADAGVGGPLRPPPRPPPARPPLSSRALPAPQKSLWHDLDPLRFADADAEAAYQSYAADYARGGDGAPPAVRRRPCTAGRAPPAAARRAPLLAGGDGTGPYRWGRGGAAAGPRVPAQRAAA